MNADTEIVAIHGPGRELPDAYRELFDGRITPKEHAAKMAELDEADRKQRDPENYQRRHRIRTLLRSRRLPA